MTRPRSIRERIESSTAPVTGACPPDMAADGCLIGIVRRLLCVSFRALYFRVKTLAMSCVAKFGDALV